MALLYRNYAGVDITRHSYSSGQDFSFCRHLYYLKRIKGFRQVGDTAAQKFGVAVEDAIRFYHANGLREGTGIEEFKRLWLTVKDSDKLKYKPREEWSDFYKSGAEMMRLYEVVLPTLPIRDPMFQANVKREVFPGSSLAGIEDQGYIDLISKADWNHPLLPKVEVPANSPYRPIILDIKVSGSALDFSPDLIALDPQLKRYGWLSGYKDVGFMWFQRSKPKAYEKGVEITLLEDIPDARVGQKFVVYEYNAETDIVTFCPENGLAEAAKVLAEVKGKGSGDRKKELLKEWLDDGWMKQTTSDKVTKQRFRFVVVRLSDEDLKETGQIVGREIVNIHDSYETNYWPKDGAGIRYPNQKCPACSHRSICTGNQKLQEQMLVQIQKPEYDWLDGIGDEE